MYQTAVRAIPPLTTVAAHHFPKFFVVAGIKRTEAEGAVLALKMTRIILTALPSHHFALQKLVLFSSSFSLYK